MERIFTTTDEMDKALLHHAGLQGVDDRTVFNNIVTGSMNSLIDSFRDAFKTRFIDSFQKLSKVDQEAIDSILAKSTTI